MCESLVRVFFFLLCLFMISFHFQLDVLVLCLMFILVCVDICLSVVAFLFELLWYFVPLT